MREIPAGAAPFVEPLEGWRAKAYQDSVGVWTIGYGHTPTKPGQMINKTQGRNLLNEDLAIAAGRIYKRIGAIADELTDNQYIALLSFVFNLGDGDPRKPEWTIWKKLRARDFDAVPAQMLRFVNAGGKVLEGLVTRRNAEATLWRTGLGNGGHVSSSTTRLVATPPTPTQGGMGGIVTAIATAAAAGPAAVKSAIDAVQPYAVFSPTVTTILGVLGAIGAAFAIANLVIAWKKKREEKH